MLTGAALLLPAIPGAALAAALVRAVGRRPAAGELRLYGLALLLAAAIYVGFAVAFGPRDTPEVVAFEAVGFSFFGLFGMFGWRGQPTALAMGWLLHLGWDFVPREAIYVPGWFPWLCLGFDLVIAGRILMIRNRL